MNRLTALDLMRGLGISMMVFLHAATFHYEAITTVDFDNPPLLITVIGFLLMWAGLFALISTAAYTFSSGLRLRRGTVSKGHVLRNFLIAGAYLLSLHYLYFLVLAPKLLDLTDGQHLYALLPGLLAQGSMPPLYPERLFYATTLSMIAWNLLLIGPLIYLLLRRSPTLERAGRWLAGLGTLVMLLSLARIPLYPLALEAIEEGALLPSLVLGFLVNKNNPILPYLAFGLFGGWLGLSLVKGVSARALRPVGVAGVAWLLAGITGILLLPATMLEREIDLFWYFLTLSQLGLFLILLVAVLFIVDVKRFGKRALEPLTYPMYVMGVSSLTVFLLETPLSELLAKLVSVFLPTWQLSLNGCLIFGAANVILWLGIMRVWARYDFKYSAEWLTVRLYDRLKRPSSKLPRGLHPPQPGFQTKQS